MKVNFRVVIPARYASTRFPGKPLADLCGKPMIHHVIDRAFESGAVEVIVATDDERIQQSVSQLDVKVCMTSSQHETGTDRIAEVVELCSLGDEEIIVNLQGDEPTMPTGLIQQVASNLAQNEVAKCATLCIKINNIEDLINPNVVKVLFDRNNMAVTFSRQPTPSSRDDSQRENNDYGYRHLGIYAYRAGFLRLYTGLTTCEIETSERLEQLRILYHGFHLHYFRPAGAFEYSGGKVFSHWRFYARPAISSPV